MRSKCPVCRVTKYMTRHHVIPQRYLQYMGGNVPEILFELCQDCHDLYEREYSLAFQRELAEKKDILLTPEDIRAVQIVNEIKKSGYHHELGKKLNDLGFRGKNGLQLKNITRKAQVVRRICKGYKDKDELARLWVEDFNKFLQEHSRNNPIPKVVYAPHFRVHPEGGWL